MNVTFAVRTFAEEKPEEWQHISVWDGESWQHGYYRNSENHTYPHDICRFKNNPFSDIEGYTDEAEWKPYEGER